MLQDIRANSQGTIAKIIIGLIVISFSIFGIESLLFSGGSGGAAEVNGEEISAFALQQEISVQQRQLLSMLGPDADPALLDDDRLAQQALEALVSREILRQEADDMGLTASDAVLGEIIGSMEQFQIDGQFSNEMFQSVLANAGFTPSLFQARMREDLQIGQLRAGVAGSDFSTTTELDLAARIAYEGRDVRYITVPVASFLDGIEVAEEAIDAYYEVNADRFLSEEEVAVEYIELQLDDYREPVDEELVREEFELVRDEFEVASEARVSHILLEGDDDERAAAVAEVQDALRGGMSFADAAQAYSDDIGSAGFGGDLGFTAGDTFPEEMEAAIATLAIGEQSGPVDTEAGTHILLLTERREGSSVTFEDVAAELENRLQEAEAGAALLRDVEDLRDMAFNAADLASPADALGLEVAETAGITRQGGDDLFAEARVLNALFSAEVLEEGHNSEVIELSPARFAVVRVTERQESRPQPLEAVRAEIIVTLRDELALAAAAEQASALEASVSAGSSVEDAALAADLEWQVELGARRNSLTLPAAVRERLFALATPDTGASTLEVVTTDPDAAYLLEFSRVSPGNLNVAPPAEQVALRQRISGEAGGVVQQQYEGSLRDSADVVLF
ncbi:MAG: SurA N-terminal domain-containing protein [Pseudomonadota bacterium]